MVEKGVWAFSRKTFHCESGKALTLRDVGLYPGNYRLHCFLVLECLGYLVRREPVPGSVWIVIYCCIRGLDCLGCPGLLDLVGDWPGTGPMCVLRVQEGAGICTLNAVTCVVALIAVVVSAMVALATVAVLLLNSILILTLVLWDNGVLCGSLVHVGSDFLNCCVVHT